MRRYVAIVSVLLLLFAFLIPIHAQETVSGDQPENTEKDVYTEEVVAVVAAQEQPIPPAFDFAPWFPAWIRNGINGGINALYRSLNSFYTFLHRQRWFQSLRSIVGSDSPPEPLPVGDETIIVGNE